MSISTTYFLNVALHAAILSVVASLALLAMQQARHRSVTAIAGLLAVGFLPWVTALRPEAATKPAVEIEAHVPALPTWTVATVPVAMDSPAPAGPIATPSKPNFPDPLTSGVAIWAAGTGMGLVMLALAMIKVRIWRKLFVTIDDPAWATLRSLVPEIPARDHFRISETTASPCVTGFWRPRILLPRFLFEPGSEEGLRWAVRHETAHWQAADSRWMILFALIRCTNWWNPLIHRQVNCWDEARERLCDLNATGDFHNRANYGEFLIAMARRITRQPPLSVAMAKRLHAIRLKRRIVSLLEASAISEKPVGRSFIAIGTAIFGACAAIISGVRISAEEAAERGNAFAESPTNSEQPVTETKSAPSVPTQDSIKDHEDSKTPVGPEQFSQQVKTTARLVMTKTKPTLKNGAILSNSEILPYLRDISTSKGCTLMTAPSVTNRFGDSATIEIIREVPGTARQIAEREPDASVPIVGIVFESFAELQGDQATLKFGAAYHFIPGEYEPILHSNVEVPKGLDPDKIKIAEGGIAARLNSGQSICVDLGEIKPGMFLQVFTRVEAMDGAGRPLDGFRNGKVLAPDEKLNQSGTTAIGLESEAALRKMSEELKRRRVDGTLPLPNIRGTLRLSAQLVDLPIKGERPRGEGLVIGLTPTTRNAADRILSTPGAKVRRLKPVEIPLNKRDTPWPEFPGLRVTAIASRDFKLLTISSHAIGNGVAEFPNTWPDVPSGSMMNFGIRTEDTTIERRLLINVEAIRLPNDATLEIQLRQRFNIQDPYENVDPFQSPQDPPIKSPLKKS